MVNNLPPAPQERMSQTSPISSRHLSNKQNISHSTSRPHRKKTSPHRENPALPLEHHRFKPAMEASRLRLVIRLLLTSNDKKPVLPGLNYKNIGATSPEACRFKQVMMILLLGWLSTPGLIIRQCPRWQNTLHFQEYAPSRPLCPTYHPC